MLAKLGIGSRKELRQWFRAPKGSALGGKEKTVTPALKLGPIGQISRSVKDIRRAEDWYGKVLGLPHLYTFGELAFFDCGGTRLYLQQAEGEPPAESVLYLRVEDIEQAHVALQARGVEFINAPHLIFRHPDGMEEWMAFYQSINLCRNRITPGAIVLADGRQTIPVFCGR